MAYSIGHISGCHLNPAVTLGLAAGGRFPAKDVGPYVAAQVIGAILAAGVLMRLRAAHRASTSPKGSPPMAMASTPRVDTACSPVWWPRSC